VKWEYLVFDYNDGWNDLGKEGWELVAVVPVISNGIHIGYFKRLVKE